MTGTYELAPREFEETYGIINTGPGKFEVYIDLCLKENELGMGNCPIYQGRPHRRLDMGLLLYR